MTNINHIQGRTPIMEEFDCFRLFDMEALIRDYLNIGVGFDTEVALLNAKVFDKSSPLLHHYYTIVELLSDHHIYLLPEYKMYPCMSMLKANRLMSLSHLTYFITKPTGALKNAGGTMYVPNNRHDVYLDILNEYNRRANIEIGRIRTVSECLL